MNKRARIYQAAQRRRRQYRHYDLEVIDTVFDEKNDSYTINCKKIYSEVKVTLAPPSVLKDIPLFTVKLHEYER